MAAEVGLLAHSNVGVAYKLRDKMDLSVKPSLDGPARLFLDLLFPVKALHPPLTLVLGKSC
jgi:hypothetical protein